MSNIKMFHVEQCSYLQWKFQESYLEPENHRHLFANRKSKIESEESSPDVPRGTSGNRITVPRGTI